MSHWLSCRGEEKEHDFANGRPVEACKATDVPSMRQTASGEPGELDGSTSSGDGMEVAVHFLFPNMSQAGHVFNISEKSWGSNICHCLRNVRVCVFFYWFFSHW